MSLSGDLRSMPLADVLAFACSRSGGGVLTVEQRFRRKEIRLVAGRVVSCTSGGVKERLGQRLIAGHRIRESVLIDALAEQDAGGGRLGDILLRRRLVDGVVLGSELDRQGHAALDDLFTWEAGSFTLRPYGPQDETPRVIEATCTDVILSGCARADRLAQIRAAHADRALRFRVEPSRYPQGFPRDRLEDGLIRLVLQGLGSAEICLHRHEEDFVVQSALARLVEEGLLQPVVATDIVTDRSVPAIVRDADALVREGSWEAALALLQAGMAQHGEEGGLVAAAARLRQQSREKLTWSGGLDVTPVSSPALEERGTSFLSGAERVVAQRVDGTRPLRSIVRGCPVDDDVAFAAFVGLFQRGLLHLRSRHAEPPPSGATAPAACEPVGAAAKAVPRTRGWEPPPRGF